jgi:streptogramin lyase
MTLFLLTFAVAAGPMAEPTITAAAGTGAKGYAGDGGPATKALLDNPFDVAFDHAGNLFFSDTNNHVIRKVDAKTNTISTIAGTGKKGYTGDGGPAVAATMNEPYGLEVNKNGDVFFVDRLNYCIRKVDGKTGTISTVAGNGKSAYSGDGGPASNAHFLEPNGLCLHQDLLFVADVKGQRIRKIDLKTGIISTLVGTGERKNEGDGGPLAQAKLNGPRAVAMGPDGQLYVVEREGHCVRRINLNTGTIHRFAGTGKKGYTGDGGPALECTFDGPKELDIDSKGNVYVVDTENEAIRKIDGKTGVVSTVAGSGKSKTPGLGDNGPAVKATLGRPHGVAVGPDGALYIGDTLSHRIRVVK